MGNTASISVPSQPFHAPGPFRYSFWRPWQALLARWLADPVIYTLTGTFSGSLGSQVFNNQAGAFLFTGDTDNVTTPDQAFFNTLGAASFS